MRRILLTACLALWLAPWSEAADSWRLEVSAGKHHRDHPMLTIPVPNGQDLPSRVHVRGVNGGSVGQTIPTNPPRLLFRFPGALKAGERQVVTIQATKEPEKTRCRIVPDERGNLTIQAGETPILTYRATKTPSPIDGQPYYARSGYIHPLCDPRGRAVTDDFAPDHPHQHGVFMAWVNTTYAGRRRDFWNQKKQQGDVRHVAVDRRVDGPVAALLETRLEHHLLPEKTAVLDERWRIIAWSEPGRHVVDLESEQRIVGEQPLEINRYHYGGFGIRGRRNWTTSTSDFLTSAGKTRTDGNHAPSRWCTIWGRAGEGASSITVLDHGDNFRHPQPVRLHPEMPYFCYSPMVLGSFKLEPGKPFVSRYRLIITADKPHSAENDRFWRDYVSPPEVEWLRE